MFITVLQVQEHVCCVLAVYNAPGDADSAQGMAALAAVIKYLEVRFVVVTK